MYVFEERFSACVNMVKHSFSVNEEVLGSKTKLESLADVRISKEMSINGSNEAFTVPHDKQVTSDCKTPVK